MKNIYLWALGFIAIGGLMGWLLGSSYITSQLQQNNGLVLGVGGGPGVSVAPGLGVSDAKLSDFRVQVNSLFQQHVVLVGEYIDALINGKDITPSVSALDENTNSIADIVDKAYGDNAKNKFKTMWNQHIQEYTNYTKSALMNNAGGKTAARNNLSEMADEFGKLIQQEQTGNVDAAKLSSYMKQHAFGTLLLIDAMVAGDQSKIAQLQKTAYDQAGSFADYFTQLVASQNPDMFR